MLKLVFENNIEEWTYDGIKIIQSNCPNKLIKNLKNIEKFIDDRYINSRDIYILSEFSTLGDFLNWNKTGLMNPIINNLTKQQLSFIDENKISDLISELNISFSDEAFEMNYNLWKILSILIKIKDNYLNKNTFNKILKLLAQTTTTKTLIIINDVSWISLSDLKNNLNYFNFVIVTYNFKNYVNNCEELELVVFNKNDNFLEIMDKEKLKSYLESKINLIINENFWTNYLKDKNTVNFSHAKIDWEILQLF